MRYQDALKRLGLVLALLVLAACSNLEGTAEDGDTPSDGDISGRCVSVRDCPTGASCILIGSEYLCTVPCTENADCQTDFPGGCCKRMGSGSFCAPIYACGPAIDGDQEPDGDDPDGDQEPGTCTADEYTCKDARTVERCGNDGTWSTYKTCGEGSCCFRGACVSTEGGAANCDMGDFACIPDTYRCRGMSEVQKCSSDGSTWLLYRDCPAAEICVDGICRDIGDGDVSDGDEPDGDQTDGDIEPEVCETPCTIETGCVGDDEYCFKPRPSDTEGCCTRLCDLPGAPNCPRGFTCKAGICQPMPGFCKSDADCRYDRGEFCYKIPGQPDGFCEEYCFNDGQWCPTHATCTTNREDPNYGKCVHTECGACNFDQQCTGDPNFGPGFYCNVPPGQTSGCCIQMCGNNNPCRAGLVCCNDGRCGVNCGMETCSQTCQNGYRCDPLYDACVLNCPPCGPNQYCDASTAPNCKEGACTNPFVCGIILKSCCFGYRCSAIVYGVLGYCI